MNQEKHTDRRSILRSGALRAIGSPFTGLLGLINVSIIIAQTGSLQYGAIALVATIGQLVPFADLGIGPLLTTAVARHETDKQSWRLAVWTFQRGMKRLLFVPVVVLLVASLGALTNSWQVVLGREMSSSAEWTVALAVFLWSLTVPLGLGLRLITGFRRNDISTFLLMLSSAVTLFVTLIFAATNATGMEYVLSSILGGLVVNILAFMIGIKMAQRRSLVLFHNFWTSANSGEVNLLAGSMWLLITSISFPIGMYAGRLLLAQTGTELELSEYALAMQFYGIAWGIVAAVSTALWPAYARMRGSLQGTRRLWRNATIGLGAFGIAVCLGFVVLGGWVSRIVSSNGIELDFITCLSFGLMALAQCLYQPSAALFTLPGELRIQATMTVVMSIISITSAAILIPSLGAAAVAISAAIAVVVGQIIPNLVIGNRMLRARFDSVDPGSAENGVPNCRT